MLKDSYKKTKRWIKESFEYDKYGAIAHFSYIALSATMMAFPLGFAVSVEAGSIHYLVMTTIICSGIVPVGLTRKGRNEEDVPEKSILKNIPACLFFYQFFLIFMFYLTTLMPTMKDKNLLAGSAFISLFLGVFAAIFAISLWFTEKADEERSKEKNFN